MSPSNTDLRCPHSAARLVKLGLIARGEDRGLGVASREFARHVPVERTLLIRPQGAHDVGLQQHVEWFAEDAIRVDHWAGPIDSDVMKRFLDGLDCVYSLETFYDWRMCDLARELGVRTVCHVMPEYFKHAPNVHNRFADDLPAADVWWNPTSWRAEHLPPEVEVVPVPIALDRFAGRVEHDGPVRWLHVVGSRASADRNGTRVFLEAVKHLHAEQTVILRSQSEPFYPTSSVGRNVRIEVEHADVPDYWTIYEGADGLVFPRRYGGLSLVAQEAMAAGLALVMPSVEPQLSTWPIIPIAAPFENSITTSAGSVPICAPDAKDLAATMDWHAKHPGPLHKEQQRSLACAAALSWTRLLPTYLDALERACG